MTISSFRQKTLAAALTAPGQGSPASFGPHPGTETVLPFARSL